MHKYTLRRHRRSWRTLTELLVFINFCVSVSRRVHQFTHTHSNTYILYDTLMWMSDKIITWHSKPSCLIKDTCHHSQLLLLTINCHCADVEGYIFI